MFIFVILIQLFSLCKSSSYQIIIDSIFNQIETYNISLDYCPKLKSEYFHFRGRPTYMENIINNEQSEINPIFNNNIKYEDYQLVYLTKSSDLTYINYFADNTVFIIENKNILEKDYDYKYCFLYIDYKRYIVYEDYSSYSYMIINPQMDERFEYINFNLKILSIFTALISLIFIVKIFYSKDLIKFYIYKINNWNIMFSLFLLVSSMYIKYLLLFGIINALYKSYLISHLFLLLNGYSIIHYNYTSKFRGYLCFFFILSEIIFTLIFEYIIYFITSLDNFYFFFTKSIIEHTALLITTFITFNKLYLRLFKQYKFERRLRTILTIGYRIKIIIYTKIMIFSFLYNLLNIVLLILEISFHLNYYIEGFFYIYYLNTCLELLFAIILSILFMPLKTSPLYYIPVVYDFGTLKFLAQIKANTEKSLNISQLRKDLLKNYKKKEYPLIFISPFAKTEKVFNSVHLGLVV